MKRRWLAAIFIGALGSLGAGVIAAGPAPSRLYEMSTETGMPHLETNLRYAVVTKKRCLSTHDLSGAFWMLNDVSLQDCTLVKAVQDTDSAAYVLQCSGGHGTTGEARWQFEPNGIAGTLNVRLGGKNMTFFQRITAKPIGECDGADDDT